MKSEKVTWRFGGRELICDRPILVGVINVTPDSFSDGGRFFETLAAVEQARELVDEGADIIDVGGESTRPGSDPVDTPEELRRVIPVIRGIREAGIGVPISIDTRKFAVVKAAVEVGATIVNDVRALRDDPEIADFCAETGVGVVLMHMQGTPKTMQDNPYYEDVIGEIGQFFESRMEFAISRGVKPEQIVLDPGIGFGKTVEHNLRIIRECGAWLKLGRPIMVGPSRKSFIGKILDVGVDKRLNGTIGACVIALMNGARLFRVHDVRPVREALTVAYAAMTGEVEWAENV